MDLERLDELLASHDRLAVKVKKRYPEAEPALIPKEIVAAARAYRDLLANGERVEPDYEAAVQMWWGMLGREGQSPEPNTVLAKLIVDAAIGDRLLVDPPTEED